MENFAMRDVVRAVNVVDRKCSAQGWRKRAVLRRIRRRVQSTLLRLGESQDIEFGELPVELRNTIMPSHISNYPATGVEKAIAEGGSDRQSLQAKGSMIPQVAIFAYTVRKLRSEYAGNNLKKQDEKNPRTSKWDPALYPLGYTTQGLRLRKQLYNQTVLLPGVMELGAVIHWILSYFTLIEAIATEDGMVLLFDEQLPLEAFHLVSKRLDIKCLAHAERTCLCPSDFALDYVKGNCEEDLNRLHRRLSWVVTHYGQHIGLNMSICADTEIPIPASFVAEQETPVANKRSSLKRRVSKLTRMLSSVGRATVFMPPPGAFQEEGDAEVEDTPNVPLAEMITERYEVEQVADVKNGDTDEEAEQLQADCTAILELVALKEMLHGIETMMLQELFEHADLSQLMVDKLGETMDQVRKYEEEVKHLKQVIRETKKSSAVLETEVMESMMWTSDEMLERAVEKISKQLEKMQGSS